MAVGRRETVEGVTYTIFSDEDMKVLHEQLAAEVHKKIPGQIDLLVEIARGGKEPARRLSDLLGIKLMQTLGYTSYGKNLKPGELEQTQDVDPESVKDQIILLVDDVADKGTTIIEAARHLMELGAKKVYIATVSYKPHSKKKPDFWVHTTTDWIIFPFERNETAKNLRDMWVSEGMNLPDIKHNLLKLGLNVTDPITGVSLL